MQRLRAIYFLLLWASLLLFIGNVSIPFFEGVWLSEVEARLQDFEGYGSIVRASGVFAWALALGMGVWGVGCIFGLFYFKKVARTAYLALVVVSVMFQLVGGIRVMAPYEAFFYAAFSTIDGAVLTIAYTSPIGREFH